MHNSFPDSPSNMVFNCFTLDATFYDRNFLSAFAAIWLTLSFLPVISLLFCLFVIFAALLAFFVFWAAVLIVTILSFVCLILLAAALVAFWIALTVFTIWFSFNYLLKSCFNFVPYSAAYPAAKIHPKNRNSFD
uniref:Uncharacterized protein n=1 Tax=Romanomermis culicivorax TaxID=13658 RepID=A0A915J5D3_ROMCU